MNNVVGAGLLACAGWTLARLVLFVQVAAVTSLRRAPDLVLLAAFLIFGAGMVRVAVVGTVRAFHYYFPW